MTLEGSSTRHCTARTPCLKTTPRGSSTRHCTSRTPCLKMTLRDSSTRQSKRRGKTLSHAKRGSSTRSRRRTSRDKCCDHRTAHYQSSWTYPARSTYRGPIHCLRDSNTPPCTRCSHTGPSPFVSTGRCNLCALSRPQPTPSALPGQGRPEMDNLPTRPEQSPLLGPARLRGGVPSVQGVQWVQWGALRALFTTVGSKPLVGLGVYPSMVHPKLNSTLGGALVNCQVNSLFKNPYSNHLSHNARGIIHDTYIIPGNEIENIFQLNQFT